MTNERFNVQGIGGVRTVVLPTCKCGAILTHRFTSKLEGDAPSDIRFPHKIQYSVCQVCGRVIDI